MNEGTIASQYLYMSGDREPTLLRAREASARTIQSAMPADDHSKHSEFISDYSNIGADGISNLVSRTVTALFPPDTRWFGFSPSAELVAEVKENVEDDDEQKAIMSAWKAALYIREILVREQLELTNYRSKMRTAIEQLLITGNMLVEITNEFRFRVFRLDQYVMERNSFFDPTLIITCEQVNPANLTPKMADALKGHNVGDKGLRNDPKYRLYTRSKLQRDGKWIIEQEFNETVVYSQEFDDLPYLVAHYEECVGENYGRSFVELKMGDLRSHNGLSKAILDASIQCARLLTIYDPSKGYAARDFDKPNGAIVAGKVTGNVPDGVGFLRVEKANDLGFALNYGSIIESRLNRSMLLESAAQPTGERVTATQIMRIAQELQGAMGGLYTEIATMIQRPIVMRIARLMENKGRIAKFDESASVAQEVDLLTGLNALNQQLELDKLMTLLQIVSQSPDMISRIRMNELMDRIVRALSLDPRGLVKTMEEIQEELAAANAQQLAMSAGQQAIESTGNVIEGMANGSQQRNAQ